MKWVSVMGKAQRDKGSRGQTKAKHLLEERDWKVDPISAGVKREDLIGVDPAGMSWSIEVKNCINITQAHRDQAIRQAKLRRLPWMLMSKIHGTGYWLVQRQGVMPVIWTEKASRLL